MPSIKAFIQISLAAGALAQSSSSVKLPPSSVLTGTIKPSTSSRSSTISSIRPTSTGTGPQQTTGCAAIALQQESVLAKNASALPTDFPTFAPSLAFQCLQSVPLDKTAAVGFINWLKPYLQFQSTIGWLKNPPPSYQQPAVDIFGGLDAISSKVSSNGYKNEYEFEVAIVNLLQQSHEGHLSVPMPAYSAFGFTAPFDFISYSSDGTQLPKVYVESDRLKATLSNLTWTPSPVATINGQNFLDFLTAYAKTSVLGLIEPHADYNDLFPNAAKLAAGGSVRGGFTAGTRTYPGTDNMTINFANGTSVSGSWVASTKQDLTGVRTGQDFYDVIVSPPDEFEPDSSDSPTTTGPLKTLPRLPAPYPSPLVVQQGLGNGGYASGYLLNKSSIAVLSLPSFDMFGPFAISFQQFVKDFLQKSKAAGMKKLVIDLQGNGGGSVFDGYELFKQLFPPITPFGGSTFRANTTLNVIGATLAQSDDEEVVNNLFYYEQYLDANGKNFSNWQALYGPQQSRGDTFTNTVRYNFTQISLAGDSTDFHLSGYGNNTNLAPTYFAAKDILLLTDGYCASTCAVFSEQMKTEVGVKSVVVGGLPATGPMQAVSGTKGSQVFQVGEDLPDDNKLKAAVETAVLLNLTNLDSKTFPDVLSLLDDPPLNVDPSKTQVNLRNQVRKSDPRIPLQFAYEAADCRIFYTAANLKNYEVLWQNAADALWGNGTLCVKGSTGNPSSGNVTNITGGPNSTTAGNGNGNGTGNRPTVPASAGVTVSWGISTVVLAVGLAFTGALL